MTDVNTIAEFLTDERLWPPVLTFLAVLATIIAILPRPSHVARMDDRFKRLAEGRERMRRQLREARMRQSENPAPSLRPRAAGWTQWLVDGLNLQKLMTTEHTRSWLEQAGLRGERALVVFLATRFVCAVGFTVLALLYIRGASAFQAALILFAGFSAGFYAPAILVQNRIAKRRQSIEQTFPDALDLLVICVNAGMSTEAAFHKVAEEIGAESVPLAEEMLLTTAELSYLPDRNQAFANFAKRASIPGIRALASTLTQTERYGTPVTQALRVLADENRVARLQNAERKAAALPATLAVPVVVFFLPVLFLAIIGPAVLRFMGS